MKILECIKRYLGSRIGRTYQMIEYRGWAEL